ncbi:kinase-like domain-containing protein [Gorgonomyces haynaldii]|nr:kinase-like domain-containing protein [Gorgonomyces haynaldii]
MSGKEAFLRKRSGAQFPTLRPLSADSYLEDANPDDNPVTREVSSSKSEKHKLCRKDFVGIDSPNSLGSGSGGLVKSALHTPTNTQMAIKIIRLSFGYNQDELEQKQMEKSILRELKILRKCQSPFVVGYYGAFIDDSDLYIAMEFMDLGSLQGVYKRQGKIPEPFVSSICYGVLRGLYYLFDAHEIVHRDIKPGNILLSSKGEVKISDFGVSKELIGTIAHSFTGTFSYLAPERCEKEPICVHQSDIWSVGLTLIEIATGMNPIPSDTIGVIELLSYFEENASPSLPSGYSTELQDLVDRCLKKRIEDRPSAGQLLEHAFVRQHEQHRDAFVKWCQESK